PGLTSARLDAHDSLEDLGNVMLEELLNEPPVGARQDDLRSARRLIDVFDVRDDPVARSQRFPRDLITRRQDRLGSPVIDLDDDRAALEAANDAGHQLLLLVLVLIVQVLPLGLPDALDDDLLRGLRGDAAERGTDL